VTPAEEEAPFIALWNEGLETAAIAAGLGIKATTAQSRSHRLQQRGLIQSRPRGGNYPTQRRQAALASAGCHSGCQATPHRPSTYPRARARCSPCSPTFCRSSASSSGRWAPGCQPTPQGCHMTPKGCQQGCQEGVTAHPPASGSGGLGALEPAPLRPAARAHQSAGGRAWATGQSDGRGIVVAGAGDHGGIY
jgi:hypothetical protein